MNDATAWRREFIQSVAAPYINHPNMAAVAIGGSVARGWADRHSDIELFVFWEEPPTKEDRRIVVTDAGGSVDVDWSNPPAEEEYREIFTRTVGRFGQIWPYEDDEWSEHFYVQGVNIGVSGFLVATVEGYLDDLLHRYDTDDHKQILIAAIQHAVPLSGDEQIAVWQERAALFPDELSHAIISEHMHVPDAWFDAGKIADRDEWLTYYDLVCTMERTLLRVLLGLNRLYLPEPRLKWTENLIADMRIKPHQLAPRLRDVFEHEPRAGVALLQTLWEETLDLVDAHFPNIDTAYARLRLRHRRATWDHPPQNFS